MNCFAYSAVLFISIGLALPAQAQEKVAFPSTDADLKGGTATSITAYLYKPEGAGPFPALLDRNDDQRFSKVILFGHGEGSLVAMIAQRDQPIKGFISAEGAGEDHGVPKVYGLGAKVPCGPVL